MSDEIVDEPGIHVYYVVYLYKSEEGSGVGSLELRRSKPLETYKDVEALRSQIESESDGISGVTIFNWKEIS